MTLFKTGFDVNLAKVSSQIPQEQQRSLAVLMVFCSEELFWSKMIVRVVCVTVVLEGKSYQTGWFDNFSKRQPC